MVIYKERGKKSRQISGPQRKISRQNRVNIQRQKMFWAGTRLKVADVRISRVGQRCWDPDSEYVPGPDDLAQEQEDILLDEQFWKEFNGTVETIPERLQLKYRDADCYGNKESNSKVNINMSGRRSTDRSRAFAESKITLAEADKGEYQWHHIPNNGIPWGDLRCDMVLLTRAAHSVFHVGAVKQYERYKRIQEGIKGFRYGK